MEAIKNKRILALVGIVCLILGVFLPYFTFSIFGYSQSIALWGYWEGKVVLVLTLANALFIFQDFIEKYVPQMFNNWVGNLVQKAKNPKFSLIPTILVALFAIYMLISIDVDSEYIKYGLGFYILWIGILSLIGHAIFYKKQAVQQTVDYQQMPQTVVQQNVSMQPMQNNQNMQANIKHCPNCGNKVNVNEPACFMCGHKF